MQEREFANFKKANASLQPSSHFIYHKRRAIMKAHLQQTTKQHNVSHNKKAL